MQDISPHNFQALQRPALYYHLLRPLVLKILFNENVNVIITKVRRTNKQSFNHMSKKFHEGPLEQVLWPTVSAMRAANPQFPPFHHSVPKVTGLLGMS